MNELIIKCFFDEVTNTATYLIADGLAKECAIIDSVLNFDQSSGATSTPLADSIIATVNEHEWQCRWILETHAHADHITAAPYLQEKLGGKTAIGKQIINVQKTFAPVFNFEKSFTTDGSQFNQLLSEGDILTLGEFEIKIMDTPGHTPGCITFIVNGNAFIGDTLFMPDFGTARCDFPGGDAEVLFDSIQKILLLPPQTKLYTGHDYIPEGRDVYLWQSTVEEQKSQNIHIKNNISKEDFF
ncbi:MAG: MBL fold metallo-hydrolase, partial [Colwellia sp.]